MQTLTNRQKVAHAIVLLDEVRKDEAISPTPCEHLNAAILAAGKAAQFVLDMNERDTAKVTP